jgi:hypothetical protein
MNDLKARKEFKTDVLIIDYVNLCASTRLSLNHSKSYEYIKAISEELRGLAVEQNVILWSATQLNRTGFADSDPDLDDTADSFGLPMTADLMLIIVSSEEMASLGQIMFKQTNKNRYGDSNKHKRFFVGLDRSKQRWYNLEQTAQEPQKKNASDDFYEEIKNKKFHKDRFIDVS